MKLQELFTDESKWTRGVVARNKNGVPVYVKSPEAVCWCLVGAVLKCYPVEEQDAIMEKFIRKYGVYMDIFNDSPITTFKDIQEVIKELDI